MTIDLASFGRANIPLQDVPALAVPSLWSRHRLVGAGSTNATSVKAAPAILISATIVNLAAAARFVKLYDKASAPTVGTDTPVETLQLAASSTLSVTYPLGSPFTLGLAYGTTNVGTDADTTAITAGDLIIQLIYV